MYVYNSKKVVSGGRGKKKEEYPPRKSAIDWTNLDSDDSDESDDNDSDGMDDQRDRRNDKRKDHRGHRKKETQCEKSATDWITLDSDDSRDSKNKVRKGGNKRDKDSLNSIKIEGKGTHIDDEGDFLRDTDSDDNDKIADNKKMTKENSKNKSNSRSNKTIVFSSDEERDDGERRIERGKNRRSNVEVEDEGEKEKEKGKLRHKRKERGVKEEIKKR
jgi:hypothetical protein